MKFLKITAAILSLALLTACKSGQPVQTSETVSETEISAVTTAAESKTETTTSIITTTATEIETETATEKSADDISEANKKLLKILTDETGVSGLTFHMTPDEVKELLGEPKEFIDDTVDFSAVTLKYDIGSLTFVDLEKDGNYQLAFMRLYSFDFCGITENTSRSELISALKDMGIYPEPNFDLFPEIKTLENTDQITAGGDYNGLGISFDMDGDRIEYLTASFVALT